MFSFEVFFPGEMFGRLEHYAVLETDGVCYLVVFCGNSTVYQSVNNVE